jgi:hypothetical protein
MYTDQDQPVIDIVANWRTHLSERVIYLVQHIRVLREVSRGRLHRGTPGVEDKIKSSRAALSAAIKDLELAIEGGVHGEYISTLMVMLADVRSQILEWPDFYKKGLSYVEKKLGAEASAEIERKIK